MGNFRSDNRRESRGRPSRGSSGGRSFSGRSGGDRFEDRSRGRDSRGSNRRAPEMHDVTCDKCGKECQVPFRPTGDKPVLCSDCFRKSDGSRTSFNSRGSDNSGQSGITSDQFKILNAKLDSIIKVLEELEIVSDEEDEEDLDDEDLDESEDEEDSEDTEDDEDDSDDEEESENEEEDSDDDLGEIK